MKTRPLPETDLANIASLPLEQRRAKLEKLNDGHPIWGYWPVKAARADIFNCRTELFGTMVPVSWEAIDKNIFGRSRSASEYKYNISVARALHVYCSENNISSRKREFFPLSLGIDIKVEYWSSLLMFMGSDVAVPFIDPRLREKLTNNGRRFVFSVMHERIRAADPDLAEVKLAIFQFAKDKSVAGGRTAEVYYDTDIELLSFSDLDRSVAETYMIWEDVLKGREAKKRAIGGRGSLL